MRRALEDKGNRLHGADYESANAAPRSESGKRAKFDTMIAAVSLAIREFSLAALLNVISVSRS